MSRQPCFAGRPPLRRIVPVAGLLTLFALGGLALATFVRAQSPAPQPQRQSSQATSPAAPAPQQDSPKPAQDTPSSQAGEMVTRDSGTTFKVRVNLVLVRVVVRDEQGKVVEHLKREDFQLYDNRKLQNISSFSAETPTSHVPAVTVTAQDGSESPDAAAVAARMPARFVSLLFDDVHLNMSDAVTVRAAGTKILEALAPTDRVAVNTSSGQVTQDFTADRVLITEALNKIIARPLGAEGMYGCPDVSYYQGDLIENKSDQQALAIAAEDADQCAFGGDPTKLQQATTLAHAAASRAVAMGDSSTQYVYSHISDALRRLTAMPGQRKMVFISPGFILSTLIAERVDVIDKATRAGIVIDTVDGRGLYTPDLLGDIANPPPTQSSRTAGPKVNYRIQEQSAQSEVLQDFAAGTGGTYFHNRNDLDVGLRDSIAAPSITYLLGFSPQNLKLNGSFHTIKVSLTNKSKYTLQARRGYYAPRTMKTPEETAKEEIQEAAFSQEEIRDLPLDLQTQFFRKEGAEVRLSVLAHLDLKSLRFKKIDGRNHDDVTLATVIFDENGNYVAGGEKIVEMKLRDATLEKLDRSGITIKSSFDVKPGNYLVRLVMRDKEGELMAARNGAVAIPY